jgi:hypothetical protein
LVNITHSKADMPLDRLFEFKDFDAATIIKTESHAKRKSG